MTKVRRMFAAGVVTLAVVAGVAGSKALFAETAQAKPCRICPTSCTEGVICDDGNFYCNSCLAKCAGARHCFPAG